MQFGPFGLGHELRTWQEPGAGTGGRISIRPLEGGHLRFILRRIVYGIAGFFGLLVYRALYPLPIAIDVALVVGFTVEVVGLVVSARLLATPPLKPMPSVKTMLLTHVGFLAGVVVIERIFPLLQVLFPGGPTTRSGRPGSWALLIEVIAISVLGYWERVLLLRGPKAAKSGIWADTAISAGAVPAGQVAVAATAAATVSVPMAAPVRSAATIGTLSPELGSTGFQSVTGLFSSTGQAVELAKPVPAPMVVSAVVAASAVPVSRYSVIETPRSENGRAANGYASITGLVAAGPESGGVPSTPGSARQVASGGDDYEAFIQHMKESKRPFRKPGMTVNEEFQVWLASRARAGGGAGEKKQSGFGRFMPGNSRA